MYLASVLANGWAADWRAVVIAVLLLAPNPRARVNGCPGAALTSAVSATLPSSADWYWLVSAWPASSWLRPSLAVPTNPADSARKGLLAASAPYTVAANGPGPVAGVVSVATSAVLAGSTVALLAPALVDPPPPVLSMCGL